MRVEIRSGDLMNVKGKTRTSKHAGGQIEMLASGLRQKSWSIFIK
jgi:hypothetical protein